MMDCQTVYESLEDIIDELSAASELNVCYAQTSRNDHMFYIVGTYDSIHDNPFQPFADFVDKFDIKNILFDSTSDGIHISFVIDKENVKNDPPEPSKGYGSITHYGVESQHVCECTICRRNVNGLYVPPIKLVYPSTQYEDSRKEKHYLCVLCSNGHYDDVVRAIDYFAVENGKIIRVGFDSEDGIKWKLHEDFGPYTKDTVDIIENKILQ
jgi:hypothetical protein